MSKPNDLFKDLKQIRDTWAKVDYLGHNAIIPEWSDIVEETGESLKEGIALHEEFVGYLLDNRRKKDEKIVSFFGISNCSLRIGLWLSYNVG